MVVSFGDFELDAGAFTLRRAGDAVPVEPQVFEVLVHLVRHRDRVVPKEELLDEVWGDRFVSESALTSRIKAVRQALGDDGRRQDVIRTVHGRGYQFVAPVSGSGGAPAGGHAPTEARGSVRHNLPAERTPLFGRAEVVDEVVESVRADRLVTLVGIGGAGKTRLAVAVGHRLVDELPDGAWFVDLVPVSDRRSLHTAIAHSVGLGASVADSGEELVRLLGDRSLLLVVDNCEHVRDHVAPVVDLLLDRTPGVRILATSREPLDVPGERRVALGALDHADVAGGADPAVELFEAAAARLGLHLAEDDLPTVARICRRLDGLPLALELAAAQLRLLSPGELADRLDRRLDLLRAPGAGGAGRQRSLLTVLEDTWDRLEVDDADLLGALAAFPGPFGVDDVEQLVDPSAALDVLGGLGRLVDRSLVVRGDGVRSCRLLDTVRRFARDHGDAELHARRHADWCVERVGERFDRMMYDFELAEWCSEHFDDVRSAEGRLLLDGRAEGAATLCAATGLAMHVDPGARAAEVLSRVEEHLGRIDDPLLRTRLHLAAGLSAMATRSPAEIGRHGRAAIETARAAGDPGWIAASLVVGSWSAVFEDAEVALAMLDEARRLAVSVDDTHARDLADAYRAFHLAVLRRYDEALELADAVVERSPGLSESGQSTFSAMVAATALRSVDDPAGARRTVPELLRWPSPEHVMWGNQVVASVVEASSGDAGAAWRLLDGVARRLRRAGQDGLPDLLLPPAALAHRLGDDDRAARWLAAVRGAGRPTQSFQVTVVYRRLRDAVSPAVAGVEPLPTTEAAAVEAFEWMAGCAEGSAGP